MSHLFLAAALGLMAATASAETDDTIQVPVSLLQDTARLIGMQKKVIDKQVDAIEALELEIQKRKDCA